MSESASETPSARGLSIWHALIIFIIAAVLGAVVYHQVRMKQIARQGHADTLASMGLNSPVQNRLDARFTDADQNLVADAPTDPAALVSPVPLVFSYIADANAAEHAQRWQPFMDHLAEVTGRQVEYLELTSRDEQLKALRDGRLHVTGLNTGAVPIAVNVCGFVPVARLGNDAGPSTYKMQLIVPAGSDIADIRGLEGRMITFTSFSSNSGFKAPLVILMNDFGLEPHRDYFWQFSKSHDRSIQGVASGSLDAAAVASDMLLRATARGDIKPGDYRKIYESEPFPTAGLGYAYNLAPDLASQIREAFLSFDMRGTSLEEEFASAGVMRFVEVSYKDDWSLVRRIDDATGRTHTLDDAPTDAALQPSEPAVAGE